LYSHHLSGASYRPTTAYLLPVEEWWLKTLQDKKWPTHVLPAFTMDWSLLFRRLVRQHLFVSLYRAFAESLASEHASRLTSMHGAEKNIEERLGELWSSFHRQRQMSITEELLDIVSGFMALSEES
jgi:F-type H+-transporting ATPase subunit gamma